MDQLDILWKINENERDLKELEEEKESLEANKKLEAILVKIKEKEYDITNFKTQIEVDEFKIDRLNHKLKELNFNLKELNKNLYSGDTSNIKELTELQKEEKEYKSQKEDLENEILELMEEVEINDKKLYSAEKEFGEYSLEYSNIEEKNEIKIEKIDEEEKELQKEVDSLKAELDEEVLSKYESLKKKKSKAISKLEEDKCRGCHMSIPSTTISKVKKKDSIVFCDNCGRILYYKENKEESLK